MMPLPTSAHAALYSLLLFKGSLWATRLDAGRISLGLWELGFFF